MEKLKNKIMEEPKVYTVTDLLTKNFVSKLQGENIALRYTPQSMEVAEKFGDWSVDKKGNMDYKNGRYYIGKERLHEDDWIAHLFEKKWINWNEFIPAFFTACKINKIEHVKLRVFYKSALTTK